MFQEMGYHYQPRQPKEGKEWLCWMTEKHHNETLNLNTISQQDTGKCCLFCVCPAKKNKIKPSLAYVSV